MALKRPIGFHPEAVEACGDIISVSPTAAANIMREGSGFGKGTKMKGVDMTKMDGQAVLPVPSAYGGDLRVGEPFTPSPSLFECCVIFPLFLPMVFHLSTRRAKTNRR